MSSYDKLIEKLKRKLDGYGSGESEIAKLYDLAKVNRKKQFEAELDAASNERKALVRDAGIKKMKNEKDIAQLQESRGLSASGEAITEVLNRERIEADMIKSANEGYADSITKLQNGYDGDISKLEFEEAKAEEAEKNKIEGEILELEKQKIKEEKNVGNDAASDIYEPTVSENTLASRLFGMFKGSDGKLTADGKRELDSYLERLREENGLSDEYMKNVLFALKSYGYDKVKDENAGYDGSFESLEKLASENASKVEDAMYQFYRGRGASDGEAMAEAKQHAIKAKLDVIYKHSVSREQFIYLARKMGSSMSTIYRYFDTIDTSKK